MKVIGTILIVIALVAAIVPQFSDCQSQGRELTLANGKVVPMKCHWTAESAMIASVPLALLGGFLIFSKRRETRIVLSVLGVVLGIFLILLPTALIGVCAMPDMICNAVMRPTLILTGILTIVICGISLVMSWKMIEPGAPTGAAA